MGSGTTIGEALKLGANAVGCDINPISSFLVQQELTYVPYLPESVVVLAVEPCAAEVGRGGNSRVSFAALDDGYVEVGTGDFASRKW